jgi:phosphoribosylamine---glycine ligase
MALGKREARIYRKGDVISGLPETETEGEKVFHAGTKLQDGKVVTHGGRVLCATALGESVSAAQERAYRLTQKIRWDGVFYRNDIAYRAIAREKNRT